VFFLEKKHEKHEKPIIGRLTAFFGKYPADSLQKSFFFGRRYGKACRRPTLKPAVKSPYAALPLAPKKKTRKFEKAI
jgi:hypothetical protein